MGAGCSSAKGCDLGPAIEVEWRRFHDIPYLPGWGGAICDSVGFFQHFGECWNDSLQMILLFTDGIKELTQPLLYNTEITRAWVDAHIDEKAKGTRLSHYMFYYLRALQRRFKRHYTTETAVRHLKETCDLGDEEMRKAKLGIELYYRRVGVDAVQSAMYGSFRPNANTTNITKYMKRNNRPTHGRSVAEVNMLIEQLLHILGIKTNLIVDVQEPQDSSMYKEFISPIPFPDTLRAVRVANGSHATAFYICGGKHYFYDDNLGVIPFRWDRFLKSSTYEGIEEFILARPEGTAITKFKPVVIPVITTNGKRKTKKAQEQNNAFATKMAAIEEKRLAEVAERRKKELDLSAMFLTARGNFKLVYAEIREGDFFFTYYPFIYIKNNLDETRFYTLSPTTGEPRFYTPAEVKYTEEEGVSGGIVFHPIYVNSDVEITNTNYTLQPSEIRISQRRGLRNNTLMNESHKLQAVANSFNANRHLTRKNNRRNNRTKKANNGT